MNQSNFQQVHSCREPALSPATPEPTPLLGLSSAEHHEMVGLSLSPEDARSTWYPTEIPSSPLG